MKKFILGKKIGMTTIFKEEGAQNVTLVECEPNEVVLIKKEEKDGYNAVQVSFPKTKKKLVKKEFKFKNEEGNELKKGDKIDVSIFKENERVIVSGTSKAKGFQGVVKRHGFHGSPASHGHRHDHRAPGSIGSGFPEHVMKGKRMAGRMGGKRVTTKSIKVISIDKKNNMIALKGAVPGIPGGVIEILSE
jgi:large subunit ribosomal protein L3